MRAGGVKWQVEQAIQQTPYEDHWENGIAFVKDYAIVGNAKELIKKYNETKDNGMMTLQSDQKTDQKREQISPTATQFTCRLVKDLSSRMKILTQIVHGVLRPCCEEQNYQRDEPVLLFEIPGRPTLIRFTCRANGRVQVSSVQTTPQHDSADASSEEDITKNRRNQIHSFNVGKHFPGYDTMFPFGSNACSIPHLTSEQQIFNGRRLWRTVRKTPYTSEFADLNRQLNEFVDVRNFPHNKMFPDGVGALIAAYASGRDRLFC